MCKVLCIIDMQNIFYPSNTVTDRISYLIKKAIRRKMYIIFVEWKDRESKTLKQLTSLTREYKNKSFRVKRQNDGSLVIAKDLSRKDITPSNIFVCGVNTDACVIQTVRGLSKKFRESSIVVDRKGCAPTDPGRWGRLSKNIKVRSRTL